MAFTGFPDEALLFYEGLIADNSKAYWTANKHLYDSAVKAPMQELMAELADEFGDPHVFRPYRDVRFAKDKTPYKDHQGAYVAKLDGVGYYVQVDAEGLYVAGGWWASGEMTHRFREAVDHDDHGAELEKIVAELPGRFAIEGDRVKTRPRGVSLDHPRIELMKHRTLYAGHRFEPDPWFHTAEVTQRVRAAWRELTPLVDWLRVRLS